MARRSKKQRKRKGVGQNRKPTAAAPRKSFAREQTWFPWVLLVFVTLVAYANAWPNVLVLDDGAFLGGDRFDGLGLSDFIRFFSESLLEASANASSLYRPMLLVSMGLENKLFGDWYAGFHLANILRHVIAVLLVFGFLRELFRAVGHEPARAQWVALSAALVFGVHPVLSDAVNSVYNGSGIYVAIFVVGGLWYLLANYRDKPAKAWGGAGICYLIALLYKESAVAMPALAVLVLWLTASEPWRQRVKAVLPVLLLVLPLMAYLGMRAGALEEFDTLAGRINLVSSAYADEPLEKLVTPEKPPSPAFRRFGFTFDPDHAAVAVSMWFDALRLVVWPHPLATLRDASRSPLWLAAIMQLGLLALCLFAYFRKRPEALLGLLFFYLAILPASRIIGEGGLPPQLMDRMLYLPGVGLAISLGALLTWLADRFKPWAGMALAAALVLAFVPVTWARNTDWANEIRLLEHDFSVSGQNGQLMYALLRAYADKGQRGSSLELCREREDLAFRFPLVANECGEQFARSGRYQTAHNYYLASLSLNTSNAHTYFHLARLYVRMDRWRDAQSHFDQAIEREDVPYLREYMRGIKLMDLFPGNPERLRAARRHMENALQLQPRAGEARDALEYLDNKL